MNMHSTSSSLPVELTRAGGILTAANHEDINDFTRDLEEAVRDIARAAKLSSDVREKVGSLMNSLESRSWWGQVTSGLSGDTDKELAILVQGLGASLAITQKVVQVVLKVMTQKNLVLHAFNEALVKKITLVMADTRTLDGNQKVVVKDFLTQLQKQVFDQIQQQNTVDNLELRLIDCESWREDKEFHDQLVTSLLATQDESQQLATARIQAMESDAKALADQAARLAQYQTSEGVRITELEQQAQVVTDRMAVLDDCNRVLVARVGVLEAYRADLVEQVRRLTERAKTVKAGLEHHHGKITQLQQVDGEQRALIGVLEQRLLVLEKINDASRTTKARMLRYAPVVAASLLGAGAIYLSLAT